MSGGGVGGDSGALSTDSSLNLAEQSVVFRYFTGSFVCSRRLSALTADIVPKLVVQGERRPSSTPYATPHHTSNSRFRGVRGASIPFVERQEQQQQWPGDTGDKPATDSGRGEGNICTPVAVLNTLSKHERQALNTQTLGVPSSQRGRRSWGGRGSPCARVGGRVGCRQTQKNTVEQIEINEKSDPQHSERAAQAPIACLQSIDLQEPDDVQHLPDQLGDDAWPQGRPLHHHLA